MELSQHILGVWYAACEDGLNIYKSNLCGGSARRVLQIMRAVRANQKSPSFEGLESYLLHQTGLGGESRTSEFDSHIASIQRADAQVLKQQRLAREEAEAQATWQAKKGKGKAKASDPVAD